MSTKGSLKKDASGRWGFVIDLPGTDGHRRQARRRGFPTKKAAQDEIDKLVGQVALGIRRS